jgi:transposase-like protein
MLKEKAPKMLGENEPVEVDESYVGGKEKNKHFAKKRSLKDRSLNNDGTPYQAKKTIIGIVERNGNVVLKYLPNTTQKGMEEFIQTHVPNGSKIYTDESNYYHKLGKKYDHKAMNHSAQVYVVGDAHSNTIESFWATLKRGIYGIYHQVSDKHIEAYLNEFAARYNNRHNGNEEKFQQFLAQSESRLRYQDLIA